MPRNVPQSRFTEVDASHPRSRRQSLDAGHENVAGAPLERSRTWGHTEKREPPFGHHDFRCRPPWHGCVSISGNHAWVLLLNFLNTDGRIGGWVSSCLTEDVECKGMPDTRTLIGSGISNDASASVNSGPMLRRGVKVEKTYICGKKLPRGVSQHSTIS